MSQFDFVHLVTRDSISPLLVTGEYLAFSTPDYGAMGFTQVPLFVRWSDNLFSVYGDRPSLTRLGEEVLRKTLSDPQFPTFLRKRILETCGELEKRSTEIASAPLDRLSDDELAHVWEARMAAHTRMFAYGSLQWLPVEFLEAHATLLLQTALSPNELSHASRYFTLLTATHEESWSRQEERELLALAVSLENRKEESDAFLRASPTEIEPLCPQLWGELLEHTELWQWLPYEYDGNEVWAAGHFAKELRILLKAGDVAGKLRELSNKPESIRRERDELFEKLRLGQDARAVFNLLSELIFLKEYRNGARCKANFLSEPLLREVARRTGATLREIRYLFPGELPSLLSGSLSRKKLQSRYLFSAFLLQPRSPPVIVDSDDARNLFSQLIPERKEIGLDELRGTCASVGRVRGTARILLEAKNLERVKSGDILVTRMTTPDFVPAMKRAAAIVTDDGGITCHAAIVSRELGVPCVVGTKRATTVFHDGELLEVHAHEGIVRRLLLPPLQSE